MHLHCTAEPTTAHLSWLFNGEPLAGTLTGVEIQPGSLTITSLGPSTAGRYQCVANGSLGAVVSSPAAVSMASKSVFHCLPPSLQVL